LAVISGCGNRTRADDIARFNSIFDEVAALPSQEISSARLRPAWDQLDALVLDRLNGHASREDIAAIVRQLHRAGTTPAGEGVFLSGEDIVSLSAQRHLPNYYFITFEIEGHEVLLAEYAYSSPYPVGSATRLSVLINDRGHWTRADAEDTDSRLETFTVDGVRAHPLFITLEAVIHADGFGGYLQAWRISNGKLHRHGARTDELEDYEVSRDGDALAVTYATLLKCLGADVASMHANKYKLNLRVTNGAIATGTTSLAPWFEALDHLCAANQKHDIETVQKLSSRPALLDQLGPELLDNVLEVSGDLRKGEGYVTGRSGRNTFRIVSRRHPNGQWMVDEIIRIPR
jgi:hypothetical protein